MPFEDLDQPNSAVFAGDLVAYRTPFEEWNHLVVRDWRTGAAHSTTTFDQPIHEIALHPDSRAAVELNTGELRFDGRVVYSLDNGDGLYVAPPGGPARRIANHAEYTRFAGERIVFYDGSTLKVVEPDGRIRPIGVPTTHFESLDADEQRVFWRANGCLLVAPITDGPSVEPGPGPCARSEVAVPITTARAGRRIVLRVRCVGAPKRCAGTVKIERLAHRRFKIPVGESRALHFKATRHAGFYGVVARTDDGSETLGAVDVAR